MHIMPQGVALEVDTKTISQIIHELSYAQARFGDRLNTLFDDHAAASISERAEPYAAFRTRSPDVSEESLDALRSAYDRYARVASGRIAQSEATLPSLWMEPGNLGLYRRVYLPHEILTWGGDVRQMFPVTCRRLVDRGIDVSMFVDFWFQQPFGVLHRRPHHQPPRGWVECSRDVGDIGREGAIGICQNREVHCLSDAYGRRLSLSNIGYHPDGGHISDDENRVARAAADILTGSDLTLHDRPAYRGVDRCRGVDRTLLLELGNFLIRLA